MVINGKELGVSIKAGLQAKLAGTSGAPLLGVVGVALDEVSLRYVRNKERFGNDLGATLILSDLPISCTTLDVINEINFLAATCDAIIVQLPLPGHIDRDEVLKNIPAHKDVDELNPLSRFNDDALFISPVVLSAQCALGELPTSNDTVVVLGTGYVVGQPIIEWLKSTPANILVFDHISDEADVVSALKKADIIITGIGKPYHITCDVIKEGVKIIDVGTSMKDGKLCGDCDPLCADKAAVFTPTPGGVGPLVVAYLWHNVVQAFLKK